MHFEDPDQNPPGATPLDSSPWYADLSRYHWFVLVVAALGWLFDTMDQQLFNLARKPAVTFLIDASPGDLNIDKYAGYATTIFMIGWGVGGLAFGILGDRIGRAKTMLLTILLYSLFTGLSAFATGFYDFAFYRFLTGLGVGGEFAVGVALVAEVMPDRARPMALGWLQALSAVGNMMAALFSIGLGEAERSGVIGSAWRAMFVIGVLPALLSLLIFKKLKEPEKWQAANAKRLADRNLSLGDDRFFSSVGKFFSDPWWRWYTIYNVLLAFSGGVRLWMKLGSVDKFFNDPWWRWYIILYILQAFLAGFVLWAIRSVGELFSDPRWRKNTIVGMLLAFSGVVGLWGIGFFSFDLIRTIFNAHFNELGMKEGLTGEPLKKFVSGNLTFWTGVTSFLQNLGGFFGIYTFSRITTHIGRKPAFAISFVIAMVATAFTFWFLDSFYEIFWMIPLMGFCQLTLFGGYAIYFPELFPTRLRSTGTSFCYNVGRIVAAFGPSALGLLTSQVYAGYKSVDPALPFRYSGVTMCLVFLIGLFALPFAPETRGKPLPE